MGKLVNFPKAKTNADLLKFLGCDPVTGKRTQKRHLNLQTMAILCCKICVTVAHCTAGAYAISLLAQASRWIRWKPTSTSSAVSSATRCAAYIWVYIM